jgi:hypothetical protein
VGAPQAHGHFDLDDNSVVARTDNSQHRAKARLANELSSRLSRRAVGPKWRDLRFLSLTCEPTGMLHDPLQLGQRD